MFKTFVIVCLIVALVAVFVLGMTAVLQNRRTYYLDERLDRLEQRENKPWNQPGEMSAKCLP